VWENDVFSKAFGEGMGYAFGKPPGVYEYEGCAVS
jgi:hypothetical protein